jgi:hypothetical protein
MRAVSDPISQITVPAWPAEVRAVDGQMVDHVQAQHHIGGRQGGKIEVAQIGRDEVEFRGTRVADILEIDAGGPNRVAAFQQRQGDGAVVAAEVDQA